MPQRSRDTVRPWLIDKVVHTSYTSGLMTCCSGEHLRSQRTSITGLWSVDCRSPAYPVHIMLSTAPRFSKMPWTLCYTVCRKQAADWWALSQPRLSHPPVAQFAPGTPIAYIHTGEKIPIHRAINKIRFHNQRRQTGGPTRSAVPSRTKSSRIQRQNPQCLATTPTVFFFFRLDHPPETAGLIPPRVPLKRGGIRVLAGYDARNPKRCVCGLGAMPKAGLSDMRNSRSREGTWAGHACIHTYLHDSLAHARHMGLRDRYPSSRSLCVQSDYDNGSSPLVILTLYNHLPFLHLRQQDSASPQIPVCKSPPPRLPNSHTHEPANSSIKTIKRKTHDVSIYKVAPSNAPSRPVSLLHEMGRYSLTTSLLSISTLDSIFPLRFALLFPLFL
ncbi:hypothetical protein LIA77_09871 [Sarocladium implicatum]|nr:hypothetical protein LIA77_09871 [Sarocladium implicatum]